MVQIYCQEAVFSESIFSIFDTILTINKNLTLYLR